MNAPTGPIRDRGAQLVALVLFTAGAIVVSACLCGGAFWLVNQ